MSEIINKLKTSYGVSDPISSNYVDPSAIGNAGSIDTLIMWNSFYYFAGPSKSAWFQLTFPYRFIYPSAYSMRGVYDKSNPNGCQYAKSWYVYGIHEGDEDDSNKWELLGINDTSQSLYCRVLVGSLEGCQDKNVGSFTLKPMKSQNGFRHIRWVTKETSHSYFGVSGLDVYGTLTTEIFLPKKRKYISRKKTVVLTVAYSLLQSCITC